MHPGSRVRKALSFFIYIYITLYYLALARFAQPNPLPRLESACQQPRGSSQKQSGFSKANKPLKPKKSAALNSEEDELPVKITSERVWSAIRGRFEKARFLEVFFYLIVPLN
jgi:hypothetical protein